MLRGTRRALNGALKVFSAIKLLAHEPGCDDIVFRRALAELRKRNTTIVCRLGFRKEVLAQQIDLARVHRQKMKLPSFIAVSGFLGGTGGHALDVSSDRRVTEHANRK
jgi:hypothetical protein